MKSLPEVISNTDGLYEGNLEHYLRVLFTRAQNLWFPYHNFRHMLHVTWLVYQGCEFYREELSPRLKRNVLIAAMFHDFDHSGMMGNDDLNIERAVRAVEKHALPEDREKELWTINYLIAQTQYPPVEGIEASFPENLAADILRDADLSQAFSTAWVQQVVFGLAAEWRQSPLRVLRKQYGFLSNLKLRTEWARQLFPQEVVDAKIAEAQALLKILEGSSGEVLNELGTKSLSHWVTEPCGRVAPGDCVVDVVSDVDCPDCLADFERIKAGKA